MKTITHVFPGLIAATAILFGLSACSSSPAPWTRPDESPWSSKHEEQKQNVPEEVVVVDEPVIIEEPVMESEPLMEPEPVIVAPVMVAEPEPEPEPATPEQKVLDAQSGGYAVQALAGNKASVEKFRKTNGLDDMMVVRTEVNGSLMHVLVSLHEDRAAANEAATRVENRTGNKPWVRSIESLQNVVAP